MYDQDPWEPHPYRGGMQASDRRGIIGHQLLLPQWRASLQTFVGAPYCFHFAPYICRITAVSYTKLVKNAAAKMMHGDEEDRLE
jgi:hypothetical protein